MFRVGSFNVFILSHFLCFISDVKICLNLENNFSIFAIMFYNKCKKNLYILAVLATLFIFHDTLEF